MPRVVLVAHDRLPTSRKQTAILPLPYLWWANQTEPTRTAPQAHNATDTSSHFQTKKKLALSSLKNAFLLVETPA